MLIKNIEGLRVAEIKDLVNRGGKFVIFPYTISFVVMTLQRNSDIYFIRPEEKSIKYSLSYVLLNFFIGWWGIPWGPIYTIGAIYRHLQGGKDVTAIVLADLIQNDPEADTSTYAINTMNSSDSNANNGYNIPR
ncbi:hypothetical protein FLBR109950_02720 [Flavobacterium branchiophilum]|uniref:Uncharacterized protein n=2 Tax=Flavobacterium branchiophilum TaxID=55197 RepID=G2Z3A3_FLABF|nr:hypothetical protein [Flavobacterium branchiophilum]PDS27143.1 hypothetical protein B0A77_00335 [Flavobacterium branchiophilum]CCB68216.1 Protein of unknown function [Flavobacterium branchiophilum FL-15]